MPITIKQKNGGFFMRIAIPVEEKTSAANVCSSFGRTPYFLIYDTETKESTFLDNSAVASAGGAGIKAAQTIIDNNVGALLTPRCGGMPLRSSRLRRSKSIKPPRLRSRIISKPLSPGNFPCLKNFMPGSTGVGAGNMRIAVLSGKGGPGKHCSQ